ncbi:unnamed protein product [Didymodactylos carnosus]|uniref:Nuclear receptor domain-containing protein n=1 Tax=Didymodactylos carnosus TaxID=1234261 RepID=A0A8S2DXZ5_9BILA|nr:unnamed protein product [Didymodactylos carnosus]CAF3845864.1 unnamed protein product [Didymodactylos carnosus]
MATDNSITKNQKTNIMVITGNDETFQNLLSIIQKSDNCGNLADITRHVNDLKCLTNTNKCDIKFKNSRRICRRCRLEKCLSVGTKWNCTADEKLNKQRQLEKNRRSTKNAVTTLAQTNYADVSLEENEQLMNEPVIALEPQKIPEFESLTGQDRFVLVKYNSPLVFIMRLCLIYDADRDLVIDSETESEEYAIACRQLSCYGYGEHLDLQSNQLFRSIKKITDEDPVILQLLMVIMIFTRSISVDDIVADEQPALLNSKQVYEAQSIYTSLLFRYMIEKYSSCYQAARQYSQLIQKIVQMQIRYRKVRKTGEYYQQACISKTYVLHWGAGFIR